jgi:hypothetical protein
MKLASRLTNVHSLAASLAATAILLIAPPASAASISYCTDGTGTVCEVFGVTIGTDTYNVTFSPSDPDPSQLVDPLTALGAVTQTLSALQCPYCYLGDEIASDDVFAPTNNFQALLVEGPDTASFYDEYIDPLAGVSWGYFQGALCSQCGNPYEGAPGNIYIYADFSEVTATPEPASILTMLAGVAMLALHRHGGKRTATLRSVRNRA